MAKYEQLEVSQVNVNLEVEMQPSSYISFGTRTLTRNGNNIIASLPTSDPAVAGALWSNSGVVTVSAG